MYQFSINNISAVDGYLSITGKKTSEEGGEVVTEDVTIYIPDGEKPYESGKYYLYNSSQEQSAAATFYQDRIEVVVNNGVFDYVGEGEELPLDISYKNSVFKTYDNTLTIYINSKEALADNIRDTSVISELFKYVLPTGYNVRYRKYIGTYINDNSITYLQSKEVLKPSLVYPATRPSGSDYDAEYFDYYPVRSDGTVNTINQNKLFKCNGGSTKILCCLSRKVNTDNYSISILDYGTDSGNYHYLYSDSASGSIVLSDICDLSNYRDDCQIVVEAQSDSTSVADVMRIGSTTISCDSDGNVSEAIGNLGDCRDSVISIRSGVKLFNLFIHVHTVRISPYTTTLDHLVGAVGTAQVFPNTSYTPTTEEFIAFMNNPDAWDENYTLTADIDITGYTQTPIGNEETPFTGTFNGNGHTIKGINISGTNYVGLFGYIRDATIQNLTVDGQVSGTGSGVGGIIGYAYQSGLIENCVNKCTVISDDINAGGIIGQLRNTYENNFTIKNCVNNGNITAVRNVGGIVGYNNGHGTGAVLIEGCTNTGAIVATSTETSMTNVGGIMGVCNSKAGPVTITKCLNDGSVTGWRGVGGIVGNLAGTDTSDATDNYKVAQCWNKAAVTSTATSGTATTGGIIGYVEGVGDISDNLNTGVVSSNVTYVGGLFGASKTYLGAANNLNKTRVECDVTGDYVNSIGGYLQAKPTGNCYYYGQLQGKVWVNGNARSTQYTASAFGDLNASGAWENDADPELKYFNTHG